MSRLFAAILLLVLAACTTQLKHADKASITRIAIVPAQYPHSIHYYETGPSLPLAAGMGAQAAQQRKFDQVFKPHTPEVAKPFTDAVVESLRKKGYIVVTSPQEADAVLELNLRTVGYGPAYESKVFVPHVHVLVTMTRARDGQSIYREVFAYGGGMYGAVTKMPHDRHLEFATAKDVLAQPALVAQRVVEAVRLVGSRITVGLGK